MLLCGVTNALKGLGCISLCVRIYALVCMCVCVCVSLHVNAVRDQSGCWGSTRLHEDESVSWSAHTSIHVFVIAHKSNCGP